MRLSGVAASTRSRAQRPGTWGAILSIGLLWNLIRYLLGGPPSLPYEWFFPFVSGAILLVLAPMPWQWTGNDLPMPNGARGVVQALLWNALIAMVFLMVMGWSQPPESEFRHWHGVPQPLMWGIMPKMSYRYFSMGIATLVFGAVLGWVLVEKENAELRESAARSAASEARDIALRAQMNPHVLFNAISGLSELVREDPRATEEALVNLAAFLRGLLDHGERPRVTLAAERVLVEEYLAIERIRLGNRLSLVWEWDRNLDKVDVPPLLLQPLVENALKHGIAPHRGGGSVKIRVAADDAHLVFAVSNTGAPLKSETSPGFGVRNLKERLALMGPGIASFTLRSEAGWTHAEVKILRSEVS